VLPLLAILGLIAMALRIPILAVPPLLPLIHDDLQMSEAEIGALVGLPLALFALAAVPGSLLVARLGAHTTLVVGLLITAIASGARGMAGGLWSLYFTTILTGFGVAIMQPALPRLVREWVPERIGLGTAVVTNGMLLGALTPIALTFVLVMPLVGNSWRLDLLVWAAPGLAIAIIVAVAFAYLPREERAPERLPDRWWPDWNSPLTWMLGLTFGCNNSIYYAASSVLPEFLNHTNRGDLISGALLWLNLGQIAALILMLWIADRVVHRAWPFLVFGPMAVVGLWALPYIDGVWVIVAAAAVGLASAVTFAATLALPPTLSRPDDVHRTAAGMFTIAYASAVFVPIICGALWDHTGLARIAFLPIVVCAFGLTIIGGSLSGYRPSTSPPART
jgi:CP family cyanate transporter-like MFS transporter